MEEPKDRDRHGDDETIRDDHVDEENTWDKKNVKIWVFIVIRRVRRRMLGGFKHSPFDPCLLVREVGDVRGFPYPVYGKPEKKN